MGFLGFWKTSKPQQKQVKKPKVSFWSLTTDNMEILDPTWEQVIDAIDHATPEASTFASLRYLYSTCEIEIVQVVSEGQVYRVEALPPISSVDDGTIFVHTNCSYKETLELFKDFYEYQRVVDFRSWSTERW